MLKDKHQGTHITFMRDHFEPLAAFAWQGYQAAGRGVLMCSADASHFALSAGLPVIQVRQLQVIYVTMDLFEKTGTEYPTPNTKEMLERYDVEREIVLVIQGDKSWFGYRFIGHLKNSEAFQIYKEQLESRA